MYPSQADEPGLATRTQDMVGLERRLIFGFDAVFLLQFLLTGMPHEP